ncbi:MAG: membrane protein insertase YidC [Saprospiraceae bacterium]|nr:membrane protein insertase YidC [Saprospiraceae bacterium]
MEEKQNNLSTYIGMGLIFLLLYLWTRVSAPPPPDPNAAPVDQPVDTTAQQTPAAKVEAAPIPDSVRSAQVNAQFGVFAASSTGKEEIVYLKNDLITVALTSKGGRIKEVLLNKYLKINSDSTGKDVKYPLSLQEDAKNRFELELPVASAASGKVNTSDLYFKVLQDGQSVTFRADAGDGRYFEQSYTLKPDNYELTYKVSGSGMQSVLNGSLLKFNWVNYLDKLEKNQTYERTMSSVYYKPVEESSSYCNCRSDDVASLGTKPVQWFSHANQFFNTAIVARDFAFLDFVGETHVYTDADPDLKMLKTTASIPFEQQSVTMTMYTGPNEFDRLLSYKLSLEDIIPFGASIFGAINRWVIHWIFDVLIHLIGIPGLVILLLTLIVKLLVYPLTYRMVYSQARMAALKPRIDELKKKFGDDQQAMSVETMKMYSEFKVNPLGGCLPIFLQMPIWFALYRFFPAAIEFRQAGFLWATDLSSYDVAFRLPFMMPGFGEHISAFTLIWVATTLWYTWYSMKQMDTSAMANPAMKYMQYFMPLMFMFFFNSFASGLTLYLCFSNILNIGQTVVTKSFLINHDKIKAELEANRNKPKKTTGFRAKLENAMKEAQKQQDERNKQAGTKKK